MSIGINGEIIEEIKSRIDITDVIGRVVALKRAGNNFKGLCPFHHEKSPSFVVSADKQIFTCFGCGASGDVIEFVKRTENLDFHEAVEKLAQECGIEIKKSTYDGEEKKNSLYEVSRMAARFYYNHLREKNNPGLEYIMKRSIDGETAKRFGIGFASNNWQDLLNYFQSQGTDLKLLEELGLVSQGKKGYYDKFRNRLMFPIINTRGKVIGFGGRAIDDGNPKYLNSQESIIFQKKNNLYGLNLAKQEIGNQDYAILVEGYMDVIGLYRFGLKNAVASLGTALTINQAKLLKRYSENIVLCYDSDMAGQAATLRGIDVLCEAGCKVRILRLSDGKDPDEFLKKHGTKAFEVLIHEATHYMDYKISCIKNKNDINTTDGSVNFLREIALELKKMASPVERETYIKKVALMSKISEHALTQEVEGRNVLPQRKPENHTLEKSVKTQVEGVGSSLERHLIKLMLSDAKYIRSLKEQKELFEKSRYYDLANYIFTLYEEEPTDDEIDIKKLMDTTTSQDQALLEEINKNVFLSGNEEEIFQDCLQTIKRKQQEKRRIEIIKILQILNEEEDKEQIDHLVIELQAINLAISS